ncbi:MAG: DUF2442 domain-containing protein [Myxococcaceae bacterium]|nr:DUF2442 domain-containing protein [Myxococcaceae bacterium]
MRQGKKKPDALEFSSKGIGIHWEDLDEDLSVRGMLTPQAHALRKSA